MLLTDAKALRERASRTGYLFFRDLVEPAVVLQLRKKVLEICRKLGWLAEGLTLMEGVAHDGIRVGAHDEPIWPAFQCEVLVLAEFVQLGLRSEILRVLETLFQKPVLPHRGDTCRAFSPAAVDLTTLPHQDHYYVRGPTDLWTVWISLGDCPIPLGGLAVLPGSHMQGLMFHAGERSGEQGVHVPKSATWLTADYFCGDVLMFNSLTVHRACPNTTCDRLRLSVDYRYEPSQP
jgi:hypothetical protein